MNDLYIGNTIVGNFLVEENLKNIDGYKVEKFNGFLHLEKNGKDIILKPLNDSSKLVYDNFSDEIGENNESIYKLELKQNIISIILYVYSGEPVKLLSEKQKMTIYLGAALEHQMLSDEGFSIKTTTFKIDSPNQLIPLLEDTFMNNRSIFINQNERNVKQGNFQIYGKKCRADVICERTGVYRIDKFYPLRNEQFSFSLRQVFGKISFVSYKEQWEIPSLDNTPLTDIHTNQIFNAWNQYMDFQKQIYDEDLLNSQMIRYDHFEIDGTQVVFYLEENQNVNIEFLKTHEFEFITSKGHQLPNTVKELWDLKDGKGVFPIFLGTCLNDLVYNSRICFDIPNSRFFDNSDPDEKGIIYISDVSLKREQKRRRKVVSTIESKSNETSNFIMRLSNTDVKDTQTGTDYNPVNNDVLIKMFGNPNIPPLNENYKRAMSIALNTPDIALIQGPPGTGKTTLIKGLVARLNMMNKNLKILVSSEQHEALKNVVEKLSGNRLIPPFISSKRFNQDADSEEESQEKIIREFQDSFLKVCNDILRDKKAKSNHSVELTKFIYITQQLRDSKFNVEAIRKYYDELSSCITNLGYTSDTMDELSQLKGAIQMQQDVSDEEDLQIKLLRAKIESQRTDIKTYLEDDGVFQATRLQSVLDNLGFSDLKMPDELLEKLTSDDNKKVNEVFKQYVAYVHTLQDKFLPTVLTEFDETPESLESIVNKIIGKVEAKAGQESKDFSQIVESLMYRLNDIDSSADIIKNYTSVIGSTCAQAEKSLDSVELLQDRYDVVIVDEAARANPLDLMIPIMMGVRVILIGDHKQLPHYIETNYVKRLGRNRKSNYSEFDENLLTKSLFEIIYENLDLAWREGRIKYQRTIRINEQFRMNPKIGNFISNEFYDHDLTNAPSTVNKINDYGVCDGKNVAWLNVPYRPQDEEEKLGQSLCRRAEVEKIVSFVKRLVSANPSRKLDLGIISFYKGQTELIRSDLKNAFPNVFTNPIDDMCNTVDSYQGKEFDIVIVSGVRSNTEISSEKALGFIQHSDSRVNVALSRARKLLVFIGDYKTYQKNDHFRNFYDYIVVKKEGYYE